MGHPLVIPSGAEGSGHEGETRHNCGQMSRLRFAPLDMTKGAARPGETSQRDCCPSARAAPLRPCRTTYNR